MNTEARTHVHFLGLDLSAGVTRVNLLAFFGVSRAFGILLGTAGGGWLFATFGTSTPFVLFGFLNLVVFLRSLKVRRASLVVPAEVN
jgi:hypothetical protein